MADRVLLIDDTTGKKKRGPSPSSLGSSASDTVLDFKAKNYADLSSFSQGKGTLVEGSALPGGTPTGAFSLNTTSPIFDTNDIKYVAAASNVGDYIFSPAFSVAEGFRGKDVKIFLNSKYNGTNGDMKFIVRDATNNRKIIDFDIASTSTVKKTEVIATIPSTCLSIIIGVQTAVSNTGKILYWDFAGISDEPVVIANVNDVQTKHLSQTQSSMTSRSPVRLNLGTATVLKNLNDSTNFIIEDDSANSRTRIRLLRNCVVEFWCYGNFDNTGYFWPKKVLAAGGTVDMAASADTVGAARQNNVNFTDSGLAGDSYWIQCGSVALNNGGSVFHLSVTATAQVESVITPVKTNLTEWEDYTPTFTGFGTVSVEDFKWRQVGDSYEIMGTFTSGTSTATEARISLPNSATSASSLKIPTLQVVGFGGRTDASAASYSALIEPSKTYFTMGLGTGGTAIAVKANGSTLLSSGQILSLSLRVPIEGASSSTYLAATPVDRVCYAVRNSGAATSLSNTSGVATTAPLTLLYGDTSFASLSGNQLSLVIGTYLIDWEICIYTSVSSWTRATSGLYNITGTAYADYGSPVWLDNLASTTVEQSGKSLGSTTVVAAVSTVLELRMIQTITSSGTTQIMAGTSTGFSVKLKVKKIK